MLQSALTIYYIVYDKRIILIRIFPCKHFIFCFYNAGHVYFQLINIVISGTVHGYFVFCFTYSKLKYFLVPDLKRRIRQHIVIGKLEGFCSVFSFLLGSFFQRSSNHFKIFVRINRYGSRFVFVSVQVTENTRTGSKTMR
ncbi:hypothetical protein D3C86_1278780 [compost metagenome]